MAPDRQALEARLAEVMVLKHAGQFDAASSLVRSVVADGQALLAADYIFLDQVAFPAFFVQDLVAVGQAIGAHFPELGAVEVAFAADPLPGPGLFRWDRRGSDGNVLQLSPALTTLPDGHMYTVFTRCLSCLKLAASFARSGSPIRGSTFVDVGDWGSGMGLAFCENNDTGFLIPDTSFLVTNGYADSRAAYAASDVGWSDRAPVAFWRGSSTGFSPAGLMELPRVRLCQLGATLPDMVDAGITAIVQTTDEADIGSLRSSGLMRGHVPAEAFDRYRYHIDIDGNTNSWPGLFLKLLTGSPVLKVASPSGFRQWYYDRLVPWQNFIPVRSDLGDLLAKVRFLVENDDIAREIGRGGKALADAMSLERELEWSHDRIVAAFRDHRFHGRQGIS